MNPNSESPQSEQSAQAAQAAAGPRLLSCTNCRQRKIKCDKASPCIPCQKSGIECTFPNRVRTSRPRQRDSKARESELLRRIGRLESLITKLKPTVVDGSEEAFKPIESIPNAIPTASVNDGIDKKYSTFIEQQAHWTRHLRGDFWVSLDDEVDGLRQLLDHPSEDDDDLGDQVSIPRAKELSSPYFLFQNPGTPCDLETFYPSPHHRSILFRFYFANVDPICKILHQPTATAHLLGAKELIDDSNGRFKFASIEAITFAMYFTAVTSMSPGDCIQHLSEEKDVLIARYQRSMETALVQADFLNSMEIVTLQSFLLYIMAIRSHVNNRSSWTYIGLLVRLAHGLGIHRDADGSAFNAFEAEMRRRLWWQILVLDMRASEDRGSEPMISESSFNTRMPCNLNDIDFGYTSQHPLPERSGVTEMTYCLISMDACNTGRKLNFIPPTHEFQTLTLLQKEEIVKQYSHRIDNCYLTGCDPTSQSAWVMSMVARLLVLKLLLTLQYPLQSRKVPFQDSPRRRGLKTAVTMLSIAESIEESDSASGFTWLFNTYVPWHTLAVALAELCTETRGPHADQAWSIIDKSYNKWSNRVADTKEGMLWQPVKRLFKKAQAARQRDQKLAEPRAAIRSSASDGDLPVLGLPDLSLELSLDIPYNTMASRDTGQIDQTTSLGSDFFNWDDMIISSAEEIGDPVNWEDWNDFLINAGELGAAIPSSTRDPWPTQM